MNNAAQHLGTAVITGASGGIGAVYADRLARRGYDLIIVARHRDPLNQQASRISAETGRSVEVAAVDKRSAGAASGAIIFPRGVNLAAKHPEPPAVIDKRNGDKHAEGCQHQLLRGRRRGGLNE